MEDNATSNSPKRKRVPPLSPPRSSPMHLNTNIPGLIGPEGDRMPASPRTKVAYNFQGLQLEDGGAVSKLDLRKPDTEVRAPIDDSVVEENAVRKRMKVLEGKEGEIPETPKAFTISIGPERKLDPIIPEMARRVTLHNEVDPVIFKGSTNRMKHPGLARAYPSINRLVDSKSRGRKRMGTPPLFGSADASLELQEATIVDQDRAALTWHDDEITGHDPDDPDDDGEGINGIGFKPTPAMAYARTEKRRQQMAEYKNREAREARAKRGERRRASEVSKTESREEAETARRVRFLETEVKSVVSTS